MSKNEDWIRRGHGKVIALIHGIGAKNPRHYWSAFLDVLSNDETLQEFDFFVWKYPTHVNLSWWKNFIDFIKEGTPREAAPEIKLLGEQWKNTYDAQFRDYKEVILICHSMGGLVIKSWVIDVLQSSQSDRLDTLCHISFYATPHNGAPITTITAWNKQLKDMQLNSSFIDDVGRHWDERVVAWKGRDICPEYRLNNRYIPHLVFVGVNDDVVPLYCATIRGMERKVIEGDHSQVIRPRDRDDTRYKAWRDDVEKALRSEPQTTARDKQEAPPHDAKADQNSRKFALSYNDHCLVDPHSIETLLAYDGTGDVTIVWHKKVLDSLSQVHDWYDDFDKKVTIFRWATEGSQIERGHRLTNFRSQVNLRFTDIQKLLSELQSNFKIFMNMIYAIDTKYKETALICFAGFAALRIIKPLQAFEQFLFQSQIAPIGGIEGWFEFRAYGERYLAEDQFAFFADLPPIPSTLLEIYPNSSALGKLIFFNYREIYDYPLFLTCRIGKNHQDDYERLTLHIYVAKQLARKYSRENSDELFISSYYKWILPQWLVRNYDYNKLPALDTWRVLVLENNEGSDITKIIWD